MQTMKAIAIVALSTLAVLGFVLVACSRMECRAYPADFIGPVKQCDTIGGKSPFTF